MTTYSFLDVNASITGPGGTFSLGNGAGVAEEGITIEREEDKNTLTMGADGSGMNTLHAGNNGTITIRLLKTSPTNGLLSAMYNLQRLSSAAWGNNVLVITNKATGESSACRQVAFKRHTPLTYAKEGNINEWAFTSVDIDSMLA